jgi:ribonuclease G
MSSRLFLVNVEPPEIRVAEVRDGRLFDFDLERDTRLLGNIYKGLVENIVPGMDAAFVDIGLKRNALLYVGDILGATPGANISQLIKPRQEILVQVARPPVGTKGARVTTRLSLPGRSAILVTGSDTAGVSKRIESEEERARLRRIADRLRPLDHGLILRTEAEGATEAQISVDVASLVRQLAALIARARDLNAPAIVHEDLGLLGRIARDRLSDDVSAIYLDSRPVLENFLAQIRGFAPTLARLVQPYSEATPIFEKFGVARDIETAGNRTVPLAGGGSLVIDEAEALTAIDINTGSNVSRRGLNETVVATNLEAAAEIARQLRLRDLGGIVVVDFIDMERTRDRVKVYGALEAALKDDRNRTRIVQISPSGLVEMTRRRETQSLLKALNEPCPTCEGVGMILRGASVAIEARRRAREIALKTAGAGVLVVMNPQTACEFLGEDAEWIRNLEDETGARVRVRVDEELDAHHVHFERIVPGVPLSRDLVVGALVPLAPHASFYPSENPQFCVLGRTLVLLQPLPERAETAQSNETTLVKITEIGRHFATGKTV